jgi:hypothetical protein
MFTAVGGGSCRVFAAAAQPSLACERPWLPGKAPQERRAPVFRLGQQGFRDSGHTSEPISTLVWRKKLKRGRFTTKT